jgi:2-methylisocitrate lyase-like PEP mutase family enzyme
MTRLTDDATRLLELHRAPELLSVVNVWDVISASAVAAEPGTTALATASHSIAATFGYEDGENIPLDLHLSMIERIVAGTSLPVSADLEGGYGNVGETIRRAIGVGVVGANLEDQLRPLDEAVKNVEAALAAGTAEGIDFVLNARTDAFTVGGKRDHDTKLADAIERGQAFIAAGAPVVFVPGPLTEDDIRALVDALGPQKLSVIGIPGSPSLGRLEELGVARVSFGPLSQRIALTALQDFVRQVHAGDGVVPASTRALN